VSLVHLVVIALVQGITEFLPVSSSGHLVLIPVLTGWPDQGRAVDVAAHVGSLGAVLVYFRRDVAQLTAAALALLRGRDHPQRRLLLLLLLATVPAVLAGAALSAWSMRGVEIIAWTMTLGAVLLYLADRFGPTTDTIGDLRWRGALAIGLAQVLALVPGTSRAGITMTAARLLGLARDEAARFSMLLAIPVILGAGLLEGASLMAAEDAQLGASAALAALLSFAAALVAIVVLMRWLRRASFTPLVIYRLGLGFALLGYVYL
jgi:undecaprenyl-diphosphatase